MDINNLKHLKIDFIKTRLEAFYWGIHGKI